MPTCPVTVLIYGSWGEAVGILEDPNIANAKMPHLEEPSRNRILFFSLWKNVFVYIGDVGGFGKGLLTAGMCGITQILLATHCVSCCRNIFHLKKTLNCVLTTLLC